MCSRNVRFLRGSELRPAAVRAADAIAALIRVEPVRLAIPATFKNVQAFEIQ